MGHDEDASLARPRDPTASAAPAGAAGAKFDDHLIGAIAGGDTSCWPQLVARHMPAIVGLAWHILGDASEAEDVAQETFERLLRKVATWRPGGASLRTWLTRVAINASIDRRRKRRTKTLDDEGELRDPVTDGNAVAQRTEVARHVRAPLAKLPDRQVLAMTLVHYQGHSAREAAALIETSIDALESLLARARRTLRADLAVVASDLLSGE